MKLTIAIAALAAAASLCACSSEVLRSEAAFEAPDKTSAEAAQDYAACQYQAKAATTSQGLMEQAFNRGPLEDACMKAKDTSYTRVYIDPKTGKRVM